METGRRSLVRRSHGYRCAMTDPWDDLMHRQPPKEQARAFRDAVAYHTGEIKKWLDWLEMKR